ncbi:uncharacterized protein [Primulina eburnea]|uniref:uncharacterized protein isoform X2 n=2 Tax=Primulina eburnea TaxID=1245227 RepID=UPI003C6CB4C2
MGFKVSLCLIFLCWLLLVLSLRVDGIGTEVYVKLLRAPREFSNIKSATFAFEVLVGGNGGICTDCSTNCKLDNSTFSACEGGNMTYTSLLDGNHTFEVCANGLSGVACAGYDWIVDTINPTAYVTTPTPFTSASHVLVNISFSEPCGGGGGFRCSTIKTCNLLVYGAGEVVPSTFDVVQPHLKYSIVVRLSQRIQYGRVILVMDRNFCSDSAGNIFARSKNSSYFIHIDRRSNNVNLKTHIPERQLPIESETRTVLATNKNRNLKLYLYFTEPVLNSSTEILNSITTSEGSFVPVSGDTFGNRRFGYQLTDVAEMAVVTVSVQTNLVISRQGTSVTPVPPITFLYDSQRPTVRLSTTSKMRTKETSIPIVIKFVKPVFGFNSSLITISGGHLLSFQEMTKSIYAVHVHALADSISVYIPENITTDVSGNKNRASNTLLIRHYSVPVESLILSTFVTTAFGVTCLIGGFLTVSTATLLSFGAFSRPSSILSSDPARYIFRIAYHIQVFALSKWLAVTSPIEYYEFARGLQWSIPYLKLPWERKNVLPMMVGSSSSRSRLVHSSEIRETGVFKGVQPRAGSLESAAKVYGLPLTPMEYISYFESHNIVPQAEYILDPRNSHGWRDFSRSMFWLSIIGGTLVLVHVLFLFILQFKKKNNEKQSFGALIFPRFEIFLLILALPCFCKASAALLKGGTSSEMAIGFLIMSIVSLVMLSLFLFLSCGITLGKLLQYKEVHREGQIFRWYKEIIRVILGPGKRSQWTWKNRPGSTNLTIFGPLFEDLRGPPKYMLSQISVGRVNKRDDRIIASDDETEDAEAPIIQKLFGIMRIYYTFLECSKRVALGIVAVAYLQNSSSKTPTIIVLCMTSFQLFFMVLKKPFIKKRVQLVEIVSVSGEVAIFAICYVFLEHKFSPQNERKIGISMLLIFLLAFLVQMINEWRALYRQTKRLDPINNSFLRGLENALIGFLLFCCPHGLVKDLDRKFPLNNTPETAETTFSVNRIQSLGSAASGDKSWLKQIQELARSSFSKDGARTSPGDPSTSKSTKLSGFWRARMSGSSTASTDVSTKQRGLHRELEEIFSLK